MTVAVAVAVTVWINVGAGSADTTEKIGVSDGPGCLSGLAVMVAITAVEETVRTDRYIFGAGDEIGFAVLWWLRLSVQILGFAEWSQRCIRRVPVEERAKSA